MPVYVAIEFYLCVDVVSIEDIRFPRTRAGASLLSVTHVALIASVVAQVRHTRIMR